MPVDFYGLGEDTIPVNLPKDAAFKEIIANVSKVNNAGWRMGNFYASGFSVNMSRSSE